MLTDSDNSFEQEHTTHADETLHGGKRILMLKNKNKNQM